jgi:hypothetical protein
VLRYEGEKRYGREGLSVINGFPIAHGDNGRAMHRDTALAVTAAERVGSDILGSNEHHSLLVEL